MAYVIITLKVMPSNPEINLEELESKVKLSLYEFLKKENVETKTEIKPVAFGLNSIDLTFAMDENLGSADPFAELVSEFEEVASAEVIEARRALG